ncbi:hypothetical protein [[Mycobacterium] burgundiense]|uniref:Uncharacterized protein n=1 Tax=[Mycobacterium] burgundiense TaxID=3064286 RepID=A0ABM9LHN3_9MYCO|nr:hypothetical protein [Mycolicibacterium sp. MU0053]CAJ1499183.1 hypothetical protein MU0053_001348 [Mycolicibacterium sp. MU0053]
MTPRAPQLTDADELLVHQHVGTFAEAATTDPAWTERVWAGAGDTDGHVHVAFGMGRYLNRNVFDGFGMVTVGKIQYTVRGSRRLYPEPTATTVGPLRYEVVEPLAAVRCILEPNDVQPIAFDLTLHGHTRPWTERNTVVRGYRTTDDVTRYIQTGSAEGRIEVAGKVYELTQSNSFQLRDHSWGIRPHIGPPAADARADEIGADTNFRMAWAPGLIRGQDGEYAIHLSHWISEGPRGTVAEDNTRLVRPDGTQLAAVTTTMQHRFDPSTGQLLELKFDCEMADGTKRRFVVEPLGGAASCLGPGLYYGWNGHYHGEDRGRLAVDGERIDDIEKPELQPRLHQLRQSVARITDEATGESGWCGFQSEAVGRFPELGLPSRDYR